MEVQAGYIYFKGGDEVFKTGTLYGRRGFFKILPTLAIGLGLPLFWRATKAEANLKIGDSPPKAALSDLAGKKWVLPNALKGKVGLIHFWASWCPYCLKEMMGIEANYQPDKGKGFMPFSINVGESSQAAEAYLASIKVSYPILLDPNSAVAKQYGITGIPTTLITDRENVIRFKILGEITKDGIRRLISTLY
jgi:cytochrome c biogenesis protein CcmG, thiol:disulfide interchange protein DsbE